MFECRVTKTAWLAIAEFCSHEKANTFVLPLQHGGVPVWAFRAIDSVESIKDSRKWSHEAHILPSGQETRHTSRGSPAGASQIKACLWWVRSSSQGKCARTGVGRVCSRREGGLYSTCAASV